MSGIVKKSLKKIVFKSDKFCLNNFLIIKFFCVIKPSIIFFWVEILSSRSNKNEAILSCSFFEGILNE
uniref:DUF2614 family zinc ribbon-containing protein n=1 Tax=Chryseobacterium salviniae TaxID=3101750 RepID=UPI00398C2528